jgi:hypothetical protein
MAVTAGKSNLLTNADAGVANDPHDGSGRLKIVRFSYTQAGAGDATSTVELVKLPRGRLRVIGTLSRIAFSAFGSSRVLDIGWQAYEDFGGTAVAADDNGIDDDINVASAGAAALGNALTATDDTLEIESNTGVTIFATVTGGTIPDGATLTGYIVYAKD